MAEKHASQQRKIEQFKEVMELSRLSGGTAVRPLPRMRSAHPFFGARSLTPRGAG